MSIELDGERHVNEVLPTGERDQRYSRIRERMDEHDLDLIAIVGREGFGSRGHIRYVTNFGVNVGPQYCLFPLHGNPLMITRQRAMAPMVTLMGWIDDVVGTLDPIETMVGRLKPFQNGRIGIAGFRDLPIDMYQAIVDTVGEARVMDATKLLTDVRATKSELELKLMMRAAEVGDLAYSRIKAMAAPGISDYEIYAEMKRVVHGEGCEYGMEFIDCADESINVFHPTGQSLSRGGTVAFELTPAYRGYYAQLAGSVPVGDELSPTMKGLYQAWREAYAVGEAALAPGHTAHDVCQAIVGVMDDYGYDVQWRSGHALGLDVNDGLALVPNDMTVLKPGMTLVMHPNGAEYVGGPGFVQGLTYVITEAGARRLHATDFAPLE